MKNWVLICTRKHLSPSDVLKNVSASLYEDLVSESVKEYPTTVPDAACGKNFHAILHAGSQIGTFESVRIKT